jgi:uncharacterized protein YkwD
MRGSRPPRGSGEALLTRIENLEQYCFDEVNLQRQGRGLPPLKHSDDLLAVARAYSRRMAEESFFSHADPEGRTVQERVADAGIKWSAIGENLALSAGYVNPAAAAVRGWMDSPGHRGNILTRAFNRSAVGVWINPDGAVYFTEILVRQ